MQPATALREAGELADNPAGWRAYAQYLAWQASEGPAGRNKAYVTMSRGWALGGGDFKRSLIKDHALAASARAWESAGAQEIKAEQWHQGLRLCLTHLGKTKAMIIGERKSAAWKVAIAAYLKQTTQVSNRWLCEQLSMGTPVAVSQLVGLARRQNGPAIELVRELTENIKT